jgi:hypothetical protein
MFYFPLLEIYSFQLHVDLALIITLKMANRSYSINVTVMQVTSQIFL